MYPIDATKESFETAEIFGIPALFTVLRVSRATVPKGMFAYDLQMSEEDWLQPGLLGRHITVDHYGTILTASPIALSETGYRDIPPGDFKLGSGAELLNVAEFKSKYHSPKSARPVRRRHKAHDSGSPSPSR